jgi:hypothetical protein
MGTCCSFKAGRSRLSMLAREPSRLACRPLAPAWSATAAAAGATAPALAWPVTAAAAGATAPAAAPAAAATGATALAAAPAAAATGATAPAAAPAAAAPAARGAGGQSGCVQLMSTGVGWKLDVHGLPWPHVLQQAVCGKPLYDAVQGQPSVLQGAHAGGDGGPPRREVAPAGAMDAARVPRSGSLAVSPEAACCSAGSRTVHPCPAKRCTSPTAGPRMIAATVGIIRKLAGEPPRRIWVSTHSSGRGFGRW